MLSIKPLYRFFCRLVYILMEKTVHSKKLFNFFITGYLIFKLIVEILILCYRTLAGILHGFFHALWVHIWPSFVIHSRLTIIDYLWFTGLFWPLQIRKHRYLNDIDFNVMRRLTENQRLRAIGMLPAGFAQNIVARHFGVHRNMIQTLLRVFGNLTTLGTINIQVVHVWRHVSKITT